ncbi:MAG: U32 family peptidase [Paludibacter sp.]|nr:U32 family peptidase [Paludibacter sp.]
MRKIELLAPAKNLACGIAAVDHGADAIYIGASRFGARAAAGNSVKDIATLIQYAHRFGVKVYVALNTILTDDQLEDAEKLIWELHEIGADAIIIQDMGILQMKLPSVVLHASTQTDNRTVQKVKFLQDAGLSRVVLARELTLEQIRSIASQTQVELEVFVHGALCVSYSGQCYISEAMTGRSANRGACAQYCRLPYTLYDANGTVLQQDKHLLSLKDLDLSAHLEELMDAGVTSFKIEGRLKDEEYVKNITAYYRKKIDAILNTSGKGKYMRASSGTTSFHFEPNPVKSFRRSSTDYFLLGRYNGIIQPETPKSTGEKIGIISGIGRNYLEVKTSAVLHNGDGLSFINEKGVLEGFRINRVEGNRVFLMEIPEIKPGTEIYRNFDQAFDQMLKGNTSERKIATRVRFEEITDGFSIQLEDEDGVCVTRQFACEKQLARQTEKVLENIKLQLSKTGQTIFSVEDVQINIQQPWFFPASVLNEWRRVAFDALETARLESYEREQPATRKNPEYPSKQLTYTGNVTNRLAQQFYESCGVTDIAPGFEIKAEKGVPLMFTKHCIKYEMGWCPREGGKSPFAEPYYLQHKEQRFELKFDCVKCEMIVSG